MTKSKTTSHVILGAGQLGLAIMDELVADGHEVTLVNRRGQISEPLPTGATIVAGDVTDPQAVARIYSSAEVVFLTSQPPYHRWLEEWPPMMKAIIQGVAQTEARLVFADNLYMYGPTGGAPIHEGLPYAATGRKGRARAEVATMLLDAHRAGKVRVTIGRASDFYGPRCTDSTLGEMVFGAALAGKTVNLLGNIDLPHTYTYIRDYARGLVTLSKHDEALGQTWHVPSAETLSTRQLIRLIEAELGQPIRFRQAGRWMVGLMGLFNPTVREFWEMAYEFEDPYLMDHSKFAAAFGAHPTPHEEAIRATLAWFRQHTTST
jgi:nucleoside-diphosphate-sugar epimerase